MRLLIRSKEIIAAMYQKDEEEKERGKVWHVFDISVSDVEKVICSGIPVNKMGNLKKCRPQFWRSISAKNVSAGRGSTVF